METHNFANVISIENLFQAWGEFKKGKRKKKDVQLFERYLEDNLFGLHKKLVSKTYKHGNYHAFYVHDPKQRHIHKADIEDRIIHHLLYKYLYRLYDGSFIDDSYSCRLGKGTHKAIDRLEKFTRIVSKNYTRNCWTLKLDIKKFFANINHQILKQLLREKIFERDIVWLLDQVIDSFSKGIPLGNLTSQVFANIYMNKLDQFIKHDLKAKYYMRYADDFIILSGYNNTLQRSIVTIAEFLENDLKLELHPNKVIIRKLNWGIDFLGYIVLPHYRLVKTKTKKRLFKRLDSQNIQSYLGYLSHANSHKLAGEIKSRILFT